MRSRSALVTAVDYSESESMKSEVMSEPLKHVNIVTLYAMVFELFHYGVVLEFFALGPLDQFIYKYKVGMHLLLAL